MSLSLSSGSPGSPGAAQTRHDIQDNIIDAFPSPAFVTAMIAVVVVECQVPMYPSRSSILLASTQLQRHRDGMHTPHHDMVPPIDCRVVPSSPFIRPAHAIATSPSTSSSASGRWAGWTGMRGTNCACLVITRRLVSRLVLVASIGATCVPHLVIREEGRLSPADGDGGGVFAR